MGSHQGPGTPDPACFTCTHSWSWAHEKTKYIENQKEAQRKDLYKNGQMLSISLTVMSFMTKTLIDVYISKVTLVGIRALTHNPGD